MGKKIWYSRPLDYFWEEMYGKQKKFTPQLTDDQIFLVLRNNIIKSLVINREDTENNDLMLSGLTLWNQDLKGNFLHVFLLHKKLRDFLENTSLSDLDGIREYLYENGKNVELNYIHTKSSTNVVVYNFGLHIPYETHGYAFELGLYEDKSIELYFSQGDSSGRMSNKFYSGLIKKEDQKSQAFCKYFRLAINTIAYMKCFPDCVTDGVPKITLDRDERRSSNRNFMVGMSEKIIESYDQKKSKVPHFRKGFFRLLKSDYFSNKKGQLIYVSETMVKGIAKTVSTSDDLQKFNDNTNVKKDT